VSQWSHLYNSRAWRKRRAELLRREPLCRYCLRVGRTTEATVADHVEPHKGDPIKFLGPIQPLCKTCHDSVKAKEEGGSGLVGHDTQGAPLDVAHPWHR
jgi:5-methylcytosine-specific restriction protein A